MQPSSIIKDKVLSLDSITFAKRKGIMGKSAE
jgi:hypothetical protein